MSRSVGAVVVNADDLGVSEGATLGIVRAHLEGIVTSASLAVTTPHADHAVELCARAAPQLGLGLHLTLTSGKPVSPARVVPALVDDAGHFRWRFFSLLAATLGPRRRELLAQIELELEAQIQRLLAAGIRPDHINGERHVHLIPGVFDLVVQAAERHGIAFLRTGRDVGPSIMRGSHAWHIARDLGFAKLGLLEGLSQRNRRVPGKWKSAERFASYLYSGRLDLVLRDALAHTSSSTDVVEIMVHPGLPEHSRGPSLGTTLRNAELERYLGSEERRKEMDACIAARAWVAPERLTTFGKLAQGLPA